MIRVFWVAKDGHLGRRGEERWEMRANVTWISAGRAKGNNQWRAAVLFQTIRIFIMSLKENISYLVVLDDNISNK